MLICRAYLGTGNIIGAQEIFRHNKWACIVSNTYLIMIKMFASLILGPVRKLPYMVKGEVWMECKWITGQC